MNINQTIGKAGEWWNTLPRRRKAISGGIAVSLLLVLIFLGQYFFNAKYQPLFSDLPSDQANAVIEELDEMKISYKVAGDGNTILVPEAVLYKTRLQLAGSGILEGSAKGFELFDETKLGATDFERRLNYQRALQEELRRTISNLEEVEMARVHLVLPEESLFVEDELPASASIVLNLKPLAVLKPEQVKGIIYLVSASVENLTPENVNIIDTSGKILSEGIVQTEQTAAGLLDGQQAEMKRAFESSLEDRIAKMLGKIMGQGKAVVMVTADLNFDHRQITRIEYGDNGVVRSEELIEKESTSTGALGGVPGSATNIGTYGEAGGGGESTQTETQETRHYEIDELTETTIYAPGQLESLSTSVAVDGELSLRDEEEIQGIVAAAIGYQPDRGDQINVVSRSFDNSIAEQAQAEMEAAQREKEAREHLQQYIIWGIAALVLIAGVIALVIRRRKKPEWEFGEEGELYPIPVSEIAAGEEIPEEPSEPVEPTEPIEPVEPVERVLTEEEKKRKKNYDTAKEIADTKPDEAAALVRAWLSDE